MTRSSDKISPEEAKDALLRSGYLLENRLDMVLRGHDYYVEANTAYPDPETGKPRELDLFSYALHQAGPDEFDFLWAKLLIECVNNPQPLAFLTKEAQAPGIQHYEVKLAGLPVQIPVEGEPDTWQSLQDYLGMDKYHHYSTGRLSTQFCSFTRKRDKWVAEHERPHFDSFVKLCAALEHFIDEGFKSLRPRGRENVELEIYYPVVVVQGDLIEVRSTSRSVRLLKADHVQYRRASIARKQPENYQIDVVTERFFPRYLDVVDRELAKTVRLLRRRHKVVRTAIDRIVRRAHRLRSPEKIREALEF